MSIWVDAICINQEDLAEREQQIPQMRQIYSCAYQVVIWLCPSLKSTISAYTALLWLAREVQTTGELQEVVQRYKSWSSTLSPFQISSTARFPWRLEVFLALRIFLALEYWHRLWILQEFALAKADAPILWGSHCLSIHGLWTAVKLIESQEVAIGQHISTSSAVTTKPDLTKDRRLEDRSGCPARQWKHIQRIMRVRNRTWVVDAQQSREVVTATFDLARNAGVSDQRDKIYGILGTPAIAHLQATRLTTNYQLNLKQVFVSFTRELVCGNDLNAMRHLYAPAGGLRLQWRVLRTSSERNWGVRIPFPSITKEIAEVGPPCPRQLPSWVVCWTCQTVPVMRLPDIYRADHGLGSQSVTFHGQDLSVLRCRAVVVDSIATLSSLNSSEADTLYPHKCAKALSLPNLYGDIEALREAVCRTVIADSSEGGVRSLPSVWKELLQPLVWDPRGYWQPRSPGLEFSLGAFMGRNKTLVLGGHRVWHLTGRRKVQSRRLIRVERGDRHENVRKAISWASNVLAWKRLIGTHQGRVGLCVAAAREGDSIAIFSGCGTPMVLRKDGVIWRIIGECYLHEVMDGEVAESVRNENAKVEEIDIH